MVCLAPGTDFGKKFTKFRDGWEVKMKKNGSVYHYQERREFKNFPQICPISVQLICSRKNPVVN